MIITLILLGLALLCGCSTAPTVHGIPNFAWVEPPTTNSAGMCRGGQPTPEGLAWLEAQGIHWIVKFNEWDEVEHPELSANPRPLWFKYEPVTLAQQLFGVSSEKFDAAAKAMFDHRSEGVFVHCEHGQDRTGLGVFCYRRRYCGWSKAEAKREALAHGFHEALGGLNRRMEAFQP